MKRGISWLKIRWGRRTKGKKRRSGFTFDNFSVGSGTGGAVAQHPVRLLEGWDQEVYVALVSGCAPSCADCCRFTHSVDAGMASHHVSGADRVVLAGAVPGGKTSPALGMEEECQKDLIGAN